MRREWLIIGTMAVLVAGAALLGRLSAPDERLTDYRASTLLTGPEGLSGLAETIGALGMPVARRRTTYIGIDSARQPPSLRTLIAFVDLSYNPGESELIALMRLQEQGRHLLVAGNSVIERCYGFRVELARSDRAVELAEDMELPRVWSVLTPLRDRVDELVLRQQCRPRFPARVDTLLATVDGDLVAARLTFRTGGTVTLISDADLLRNRALKDTDAAEIVVPWFFVPGVAGALFDEYHHGFGTGGSIWSASAGWLLRSPGGWLIIQLMVAALVALALAAVRFGPALALVEPRRRSPLEHVEALATGLEGARATDVAKERLVEGLRRRLLPVRARAPRGSSVAWLRSMLDAPGSPRAKPALQKLLSIVNENDRDGVHEAAIAVEDAWEAMGTSGHRKS